MTVSSLQESAANPAAANTWAVKISDPVRRVLNHLAVVVRQALGADVVELRVYENSGERLTAVVSVPELIELSIPLSEWPAADNAFRNEIRGTLRPRHALQPSGLRGGKSADRGDDDGLDLLCAIDELADSHWLLLSAARKSERDRFDHADRRLLEELMPLIGDQVLDLLTPPQERVDRRIQRLVRDYRLTEAEAKVARYLLGTALSEQEIAVELHRSFNTVHRHVTNIYRKLDVRSRLQALALIEDQTSDKPGE